jgi:hypothetical protein
VLAGCATVPPYPPQYAACHERVLQHAGQFMPGFAALGYRPEVRIYLDEEMRDGRGFRAPDNVLGDALPWGRIRLRPAAVCGSDYLARAVLAHEMAHVALQHKGVPGTGLVLAWEKPPQQETEADALALKVLRESGSDWQSIHYIECRLGKCDAAGTTAGLRQSLRPAP